MMVEPLQQGQIVVAAGNPTEPGVAIDGSASVLATNSGSAAAGPCRSLIAMAYSITSKVRVLRFGPTTCLAPVDGYGAPGLLYF